MKTRSSNTRRFGSLLTLPAMVAVAVIIAAANSNSGSRATAAPRERGELRKSFVRFNEDGELIKPTGYRSWTHVGTPLTPNDMNGGQAAFPEFHSVYINPEAYDHFEQTGEFPDRTVLVKELISVGTKRASSGKGYFMGDFTGLEVSIKDKTRFDDEPGDWAFFSFGHEYPLKAKSSAQPTANCNVCHAAAADDDYVFTQYYPVLRAATGSAKASP